MLALTPNGVELAGWLEMRCDNLSSQNFAGAFDRKLTAMASGLLPPKEFLAWILSLTRPGDPLADVAAAKLWDSVEDLRTVRIATPTPAAQEGQSPIIRLSATSPDSLQRAAPAGAGPITS